jgi:serine O-acetyltransferase
MKLSISSDDFKSYISNQINNFFPDKSVTKPGDFDKAFDIAVDRLNYCFSKVSYQRYNKDGETILNHLYSDQYLVFIWFLSNTVWKDYGHTPLANKLYYLNKSLHAFDCMFDTKMPDIFLVFHGAGTMLGKGTYSDYFVALQGCTIGSHQGKYPVMGKGVALAAHSSIIGNCNIGDRVSISANSSVYKKDVLADHVVYRSSDSGMIVNKASEQCYAQTFFNTDLSLPSI